MTVRFVLLWMLAALPGWASGVLIPDQDRHVIQPPPGRPVHAPLQTRRIDVRVTIENNTAVTEVDQVFFNPGGRMERATYLFPLPANANLDGLTLWIDGVETPGELLDAKKARGIFDDIVRRMRDPALLEYAGSDLFRIDVFPIEARAEKRLKLRYRQVIERDNTMHRYQFPLRAGRIGGSIANLNFQVKLQANQTLKTIATPTHPFEIVRQDAAHATLAWEVSNYLPQRNLDLWWSLDEAPIGLSAVAHAGEEDRFVWLSLVPDLRRAKPLPKDLLLVIDTSGSMAGEKLEQARRALRFCLAQLADQDRFAIVRFSTEAEPFAPTWQAATKANRHAANNFIDNFRALGGTNLGDALGHADDYPRDTKRPQMIVLITDGKPTIGDRDEASLLAHLTSEAQATWRVFPFGVGYDVDVHLLDKFAQRTGGWRTYADPDEDLELKLSALYQRLHAPILVRPQLTMAGARLRQPYPAQMPDLFAGVPLDVFARYAGHGPAKITLSGLVDGEEQRFTYRLKLPKREQEHAYIAELWAKRRIGYLLDRIRLDGESKELVDEVVHLARTYGLITPYTSYLIVEDDALADRRRPSIQSDVVNAMRQQEDRVASEAPPPGSGEAKVRASRDLQEMNTVVQMAPQMAPASPEPSARGNTLTWQNRLGHAFYRAEGFWNQAGLDLDQPPDQVIDFASEAYFQFAAAHPHLQPVLAQGPQVRFRHAGRIVEIRNP